VKNLANKNIEHVFVLMLENRSFDHMLGFSRIKGNDAENGNPTFLIGLSAKQFNSYNNQQYPVLRGADYTMPFDPGHEFTDVVEQLCGQGITYLNGGPYPKINNSGFVSNYATTKSTGEGGATNNFGEIMKCYDTKNQLPVMMALAKQFAVCDNWFASLPGPTWPNRFFLHGASSAGLDHSPTTGEILDWETVDGFNFPNDSIYKLMDKHKVTWRIYRGVNSPLIGSIPCVSALKGIEFWDTHPYQNFKTDINNQYPYSYTFIEPNYGDVTNNTYSGGQSQHPMDDVRNGEALIKSTYETIRNSPLWTKSLLIIIYDEHGGFYDHFAPPAAISPGDTVAKYNQYGFTFQQYGVRVPALIISAYTQKNIVDHRTYDHSSVPATLEAMFNLQSLTKRDAQANNITSLTSLKIVRTDAPAILPNPVVISTAEMASAQLKKRKIANDGESLNKGNLPGFLHIALKGELKMATTQKEKKLILARFKKLKTRGDARKYLQKTLPKLNAVPNRK
jgi:phospholipase C